MKQRVFKYCAIGLFVVAFGCASGDEPEPVAGIEAEIKDAELRELCLVRFDVDGDGVISQQEASLVKELIINGYNISSLEGIGLFPNLEHLDCHGHHVGEINLEKNTKLVRINCSYCELEAIDVSACPELKMLSCSGNSLRELDFSANINLRVFDCVDCGLEKLTIGNKDELRIIECEGNNLTSIDVEGCPELWKLNCGRNKLSIIDISKNRGLDNFLCSGNENRMTIYVWQGFDVSHLNWYEADAEYVIFEIRK